MKSTNSGIIFHGNSAIFHGNSIGTRESDGNSERLVDGLSIRTEGLKSMLFRVVEADESAQAINYIIVILVFRSKNGKESTVVINKYDGLCITSIGSS